MSAGMPTNEYDVQQLMTGWFRDEGLVSDSPPIVAAAGNAGNPHYMPTQADHRAIRPGEIVLLDLWGKADRPGSVFADITWVGYTGERPPERYARAFATASHRETEASDSRRCRTILDPRRCGCGGSLPRTGGAR